MSRILLLLVIGSFLFAACESHRAFKSASSVESSLNGVWKQVPIPDRGVKEIWEIHNGNILIRFVNDSVPNRNPKDTLRGTYEIQTTLSTPYVFVYGVSDNSFNGRWSVIRLDGKVLSMNRATEGTNALTQEEFIRQ